MMSGSTTPKKITKSRKPTDLTNQRFGKLVALEPTDLRKNGYTVWRCKCDCGNEALVPSRLLKNGCTKSCGCVPKSHRFEDLTGQRFGKLIVDHMVQERKAGHIQWFCHCDCGGTVITTTSQLNSCNRKSCGCLFRPPLKDWVGKRFGKLVVTSDEGKWDGKHHWHCICDCLANPKFSPYYVEGTCLKNIRNKKTLNINNTSGVRGVHPGSKGGWVAEIVFKGKTKYLGKYDTVEEAADARREAEKVYDEILLKYGMEPQT